MPVKNTYAMPQELLLGVQDVQRVPFADQVRQRRETEAILGRLESHPGVILADEVGMGKTFVALAVAFAVACNRRSGPVLVMVPPNLVDKWEQDLKTFCELYLKGITPVRCKGQAEAKHRGRDLLRYAAVHHSVDLLRRMDDPLAIRCHIVFIPQGVMSRDQTDKWVRLALIQAALKRHARGANNRLTEVKRQIHRFAGELLGALGEQRASDYGEEIWSELLANDPRNWREVYNDSLQREDHRLLDDPVPEAVLKAIDRTNLRPLADALCTMPVRTSSEARRLSERITEARRLFRGVETELWSYLLLQARWRSPLLVMDEAHHLKNPGTALARQLQSPDSDKDLRTGDGAMARAFERMLFLTATPFQLGHQELIRVLERFGDTRWDETAFGPREAFDQAMASLHHSLTESQRSAVNLQRCWSRLRSEDLPSGNDVNGWWEGLRKASPERVSHRQKALVEAFEKAKQWRAQAQEQLRPWLIRHNKPETWADTDIPRRNRIIGAGMVGRPANTGIDVPPDQLLPFFLAARSAANPGQDLLGEALCSSYEAFRFTRQNNTDGRDDNESAPTAVDSTHSQWFLSEFDRILSRQTTVHPKIEATVGKVVDLW